MNLIEKQLETYAESWKKDHHEDHEATQCWRVERALAVGFSLFNLLKDEYQEWRKRVASGEEEFSPDENQAMRNGFNWWLQPSEAVEGTIRHFESKGYVVEGAKAFRQCRAEAHQILTNWIPPVRSKCPGYLETELTDEEADKLQRLLEGGEAKLK